MPATSKTETHPRESSFVSVLSGWAQQGVQTFFATQRILLDLAMRQNAQVVHAVREQLSDPRHSPATILSEVAGEGMTNFIEGQNILLELGKQQNEILLTGVKERVGDCPRRQAAVELLRRTVDTFIHMQQEFLKIADKQTHTWIESAKAGKPYEREHLVELAKQGMENFTKAQKQFLDAVVEETDTVFDGKPRVGTHKLKKTELAEVARKTTESFIEAQKKLVDVAGQQLNATLKTAGKTLDILRPFPFLPVAELTREGVKSYVDAQKALMEVISKPANVRHVSKTERHARRPARAQKRTAAVAAMA